MIDKKNSTLNYIPQDHMGPLPRQEGNYNNTDSK